MFVSQARDLVGHKWIINFPTKRHWRHPSKLEWIRDGLKDLNRVIRENGIRSVAVPPLGCGNGGLEWSQVRVEIEAALSTLDDVERESGERCLLVPRLHVESRLVHGLDDLIERE